MAKKPTDALLVDDNDKTVKELSRAISGYCGLQVTTANRLKELERLLSDPSSAFDIVVSDNTLADGKFLDWAAKHGELLLDRGVVVYTGLMGPNIERYGLPYPVVNLLDTEEIRYTVKEEMEKLFRARLRNEGRY